MLGSAELFRAVCSIHIKDRIPSSNYVVQMGKRVDNIETIKYIY